MAMPLPGLRGRIQAVRPAVARWRPLAWTAGLPPDPTYELRVRLGYPRKVLPQVSFRQNTGSPSVESRELVKICSSSTGSTISVPDEEVGPAGASNSCPNATGRSPSPKDTRPAGTVTSSGEVSSTIGGGGVGASVTVPLPVFTCTATGVLATGTATIRSAIERSSSVLTIVISGSGGTNGFFRIPSAPTLCASRSSSGSNAPTSNITGT